MNVSGNNKHFRHKGMVYEIYSTPRVTKALVAQNVNESCHRNHMRLRSLFPFAAAMAPAVDLQGRLSFSLLEPIRVVLGPSPGPRNP